MVQRLDRLYARYADGFAHQPVPVKRSQKIGNSTVSEQAALKKGVCVIGNFVGSPDINREFEGERRFDLRIRDALCKGAGGRLVSDTDQPHRQPAEEMACSGAKAENGSENVAHGTCRYFSRDTQAIRLRPFALAWYN
jgi:hypothetical protein